MKKSFFIKNVLLVLWIKKVNKLVVDEYIGKLRYVNNLERGFFKFDFILCWKFSGIKLCV